MPNISRRDVLRLVLLMAASPLACAAGEAVLAIKGYDPVAYFTDGRATRGLPQLEHEHGGLRYRFSSMEHRELFRANPARYAPQFGNYCAMALTRGELDDVEPESWLISEGKLYLFGKAVGPALFQKDLAGNIRKADDNRWLTEKR
jgi:hypothetical protein